LAKILFSGTNILILGPVFFVSVEIGVRVGVGKEVEERRKEVVPTQMVSNYFMRFRVCQLITSSFWGITPHLQHILSYPIPFHSMPFHPIPFHLIQRVR